MRVIEILSDATDYIYAGRGRKPRQLVERFLDWPAGVAGRHAE
jgi:hypothetical protein